MQVSELVLTVSVAIVGAAVAFRTFWNDRIQSVEPHVAPLFHEQFVKNTIGMELARIPEGVYKMGADKSIGEILQQFPYCDPGRVQNEYPQREVHITKPFYIGRHEVTIGQFETFCHDAGYVCEAERDGASSFGFLDDSVERWAVKSNKFRPWDPIGWKVDKDFPVNYVTWNDAAAFCKWLSQREGRLYRLPTEAEWEYACRAGSTEQYCFGSDFEDLVVYANGADFDRKVWSPSMKIVIYGCDGTETLTETPFPFLSRSDGYVFTAPIGKFRPNAFGLFDMHGNVGEWCLDWYDEDFYLDTPADRPLYDPIGPNSGEFRVFRGGDFATVPLDLRSSSRFAQPPSYRDFGVGFRVACQLQ